ncbi:MAG: ABC transporter substrate-binding protein [Puniceicoccales bacterium]|nr:ABC transporter substrate-binding protein [Puniceicoccales bacterium]
MRKLWASVVIVCSVVIVSLQLRKFDHPKLGKCRLPLSAIPADYCRMQQPNGKYGGVFVTSFEQEPKTFNPLTKMDGPSHSAQKLLFASLLEYDYECQCLIPGLAKHFTIQDNRIYRFTLRQGLQWSDGHPFSIEDVLFTFDLLFAKTQDAHGRDEWQFPSTSVNKFIYQQKQLAYKKIDDKTIEFETPIVWASFLEDLSGIFILPKHKLMKSVQNNTLLSQWNLQAAIENPKDIVGMGPFCIKHFQPGERLILVPNPYYWKVDSLGQRLPYVDAYITQYVSNTTVRTILFGSGKTDAAPIGPTDLQWIKDRENQYDYTIYDRGPDIKFMFFWFNLHSGATIKGKHFVEPYKLKWFSDVRFRRAVLYGLDRQGMVEANYLGQGEVWHSFIHRLDSRWYNPKLRHYDYNPDKAKQILKEAGFTWDGEGNLIDIDHQRVCFDILWSTSGTNTLITTLKNNMADLGIEVNVINLDFKALLEIINHHYTYDSAIVGFRFGQNDPNDFLEALHSGGNFHYWWPKQTQAQTEWEKEIDILLNLQAQSLDVAVRKPYWDRIQEIMNEQVPWIPLFSANHFTGIKNKWKNLRIPPRGNIIWNVEEIWCDT